MKYTGNTTLQFLISLIKNKFATKSDVGHTHTPASIGAASSTHAHSKATSSSDGFMSKEDKSKIDTIEQSANNYTHPSQHSADILVDGTTNKVVTGTEKTTWNAKESALNAVSEKASIINADGVVITDSAASNASKRVLWSTIKATLKTYFDTLYNKYIHPTFTAATSGLYKVTVNSEGHVSATTAVLKTDITSLGIPAQDTVYTHPTNHAPSIISQDANNRFVTDSEKTAWNSKQASLGFTPVPVTRKVNGKALSADINIGVADITDFPSSMPASDVYAWAKAAAKPSYTAAEITGLSIPVISTNVSTDATSDVKTVSPKAVKTYADSVSATAQANAINKAGSTQYEIKLFLIGATAQEASGQTYSQSTCYLDASGYFYATKLYGGVYNDYAEFRRVKDNLNVKPGQVLVELGDDTLGLCEEFDNASALIVSDTFGFAIGRTSDEDIPVAVSGRVLAYTYEDREIYRKFIGCPVGSAPGGKIALMGETFASRYPWKIIGIVSSVPEYLAWGEDDVIVDGRVWIKLK